MQKIADDLELSYILEPQHLDPTHRVIAVVDAPSIEAVNQYVFDTGLFQWNTVETFALTPISEMMAKLSDTPVVFDCRGPTAPCARTARTDAWQPSHHAARHPGAEPPEHARRTPADHGP